MKYFSQNKINKESLWKETNLNIYSRLIRNLSAITNLYLIDLIKYLLFIKEATNISDKKIQTLDAFSHTKLKNKKNLLYDFQYFPRFITRTTSSRLS